jgi:pyruvate,water dikinase
MVWLFTDRAVAYCSRNDIRHTDVAMAVVLQPMVDAEIASVLFTADPSTGNQTIASVESTYGLGDTVVSSEVSADNTRVDKETSEVLDYEVGEKATELRL